MMTNPDMIYIPKVSPAKGFWLNLATTKMVGDLSEESLIVKIWFIDGNTLMLTGEQANSLIEQMMQRFGAFPTKETANN